MQMDLKTNSQMHVHGADGLHVGVDTEAKRLVLYWGESKIYANATDAIRKCLSSLAPMLRTDENGSAQQTAIFNCYGGMQISTTRTSKRHSGIFWIPSDLPPKNSAKETGVLP